MWRILSFILLIPFIISCIKIDQSVVNENKYLGNKVNDTIIYAKQGSAQILNPFNINTDNWGVGIIEKLMLIEFDPLEKYNCIELQQIESNGNIGALVILYYAREKQADVYHSSNLQLNTESYKNILNNTEVSSADIEYSFTEEKRLLKASLDFIDRFGNHIQMQVDEQLGEMEPCGLLAPIGGESDNPKFMTIVYMKDFKFLSQKEENIHVKINGQKANLVKLPLKVNGIKGYQTKYSMEPVTISWNKNTYNNILPLRIVKNCYEDADFEIKTIQNGSHYEIVSFTGKQQNHVVAFRFSPAIPDIICLNNNSKIKGRFSMRIDSTEGIIAGKYTIVKNKGIVNIIIQPTKGYSPVPGKAWMKKMKWEAQIKKLNQEYFINSNWIKQH